MKTKKIIAMLLAMILTLGLVACGNAEQQGGGDTEASKVDIDWTKGADASGGDVELRVATWRVHDQPYYEEIEKRFEEKYNWIDVKLEINADSNSYYSNLQADILSGVAPDVFDSHADSRLEAYAKEGSIAPQTDFAYMENYNEDSKYITTLLGENYGYMNAYNYFGFIYNVDIFNKVGISVPTTPEELVDAVSKLKAAGYGGVAYSGATVGASKMGDILFQITMGTEGYGELQKGLDNGSVTDISTVDGVEEALNTLQTYTENDIWYNGSSGMSYEAAHSLFAQEKAAIMYGGSYEFGEAEYFFPGINAAFFPVPTYANNGVTAAEGAQTTVINSASSVPGAAKLWVEFLATDEISEYFCTNAKMLSTNVNVKAAFAEADNLLDSAKGYAYKPIAEPKNEEYWEDGLREVFETVMFNGLDWKTQAGIYANNLEEYDLANL